MAANEYVEEDAIGCFKVSVKKYLARDGQEVYVVNGLVPFPVILSEKEYKSRYIPCDSNGNMQSMTFITNPDSSVECKEDGAPVVHFTNIAPSGFTDDISGPSNMTSTGNCLSRLNELMVDRLRFVRDWAVSGLKGSVE